MMPWLLPPMKSVVLPLAKPLLPHVFCLVSWHGIKTHNAIKALHLDDLFGSKTGGCTHASVTITNDRFPAVQRWDAHKKLGQAIAFDAMQACMNMADEYGTGTVIVDNAFHYLWGGGYVIDAAQKGYLSYTCCTSTLAEVVPFGGKFPTLGTNPHSWGFPHKTPWVPICIDWATSTVAMGRVQHRRKVKNYLRLSSRRRGQRNT